MKAQYDEQSYRQEVLGESLNIFAGACYHAFDEKRCADQRLQFEPNLDGLAWTLDFNIDPMASLICQVKGARHLDVLHEITLSVGNAGRMCDAFVAAAQPYLEAWRAARGGFPLPVKLYGDASGHARSLVAPEPLCVPNIPDGGPVAFSSPLSSPTRHFLLAYRCQPRDHWWCPKRHL